MTKRPYEIILKHGDYTVIKYQKQYIGDEYVVAKNFDPENFSWDSGSDNYAYSFDAALACLLRKLRSNYVKDRNQLLIERDSEITFDRMCELATHFKDGLIDCDEEYAKAYFNYSDMTEKEREFFGIPEDDMEVIIR